MAKNNCDCCAKDDNELLDVLREAGRLSTLLEQTRGAESLNVQQEAIDAIAVRQAFCNVTVR